MRGSSTGLAPAHDASEAEMEVTPAMIEAGVGAMLPFEDTIEDPREGAARVFMAMVKASHRD
jgi:hypothetical protein